MNSLIDVKDMSVEQLKKLLSELREARKKGYIISPKVKQRDINPFAGLDPNVAEQVLEELMKRKKVND